MHLCDQIDVEQSPEMSPNEVENGPLYLSLGAILVNGSSGLVIFVGAPLWLIAGFCGMLRAASPFFLASEGPGRTR